MSRGPVSACIPASLAIGDPLVKYPTGSRANSAWSPSTAAMYSRWSMAGSSAWRSFGLLNGACRWFSAMMPTSPNASSCWTATLGSRLRLGTKSNSGWSIQSTSPARSAETAVPGSGWITHSTRSKCTDLPPERKSGGSARGW